MDSFEGLFKIADELDQLHEKITAIEPTLRNIESQANIIGKSASNSWAGYQASVYYENFQIPPTNARFSVEWGLGGERAIGLGSYGDWQLYDSNYVISKIFEMAGISDLTLFKKEEKIIATQFINHKSAFLSILSLEKNDEYINQTKKDIDECKTYTMEEVLSVYSPKKLLTRDMEALSEGIRYPPHMIVIGQVYSILQTYIVCGQLAQLARRAASHIERINMKNVQSKRIGTNIFIGHGQSPVWRDLKDFITDRLHLPHDEFNRVPIAGMTNIARLSEMLDAASFAFIIMTAEDETAEGTLQARMNVIHEVGLFQGRLGFDRAIVLLEDNCSEFSNIQGLGQIRFPPNNISAKFEEIRRVLERHAIITTE